MGLRAKRSKDIILRKAQNSFLRNPIKGTPVISFNKDINIIKNREGLIGRL